MNQTPPLSARVRLLVIIGLPVGLLRYAAEFFAPDHAMWFGVYYLMPIVFLAVGIQNRWGAIRWRALLGTMALTCLIVWGIPNTLAYTTGQFAEWTHGRFYNGGPDDEANRAAPIAEGIPMKLVWGLSQGLLTSVAGTVWCTLWSTVLIWLPGRLRGKRASS